MIHFKNQTKEGFSFIEIVLSVTIIGLILTALFNLQNNIFNISFRQHAKVLRIFNIRNAFFDHEINEKLIKGEVIKKNFEDPNMQLTIEMKKPDKKSSLAKFENIYVIKSTGKWSSMFRDNEETMVSLLFNKKQEKKEK